MIELAVIVIAIIAIAIMGVLYGSSRASSKQQKRINALKEQNRQQENDIEKQMQKERDNVSPDSVLEWLREQKTD